jgi:dTDP-glucose 4,6-dehydratase
MKTCLVTGGAGFIGSWLCEDLLKNYKVICVDNLITGRKENVNHLKKKKNFKFIKKDIAKKISIAGKTDFLFHLASPASPEDYQKYPIETMKANSTGTHNILELARKEKSKFLLASTSEVYGDPLIHPQKENYFGNVNPVGPRSCYDESKRFAESITMVYHMKYRINTRIVRIFNTYGPRMKWGDGRALPNFITQAINNKPITINGTGNQTRSFCYINDMVPAIKKSMFNSRTNGKIINIGNPDERKIIDVAKKVKKISKSASEITFRPLPENDPIRRKPDITKAKKILGWEPIVSFNEGLKETIEWYKNYKK